MGKIIYVDFQRRIKDQEYTQRLQKRRNLLKEINTLSLRLNSKAFDYLFITLENIRSNQELLAEKPLSIDDLPDHEFVTIL